MKTSIKFCHGRDFADAAVQYTISRQRYCTEWIGDICYTYTVKGLNPSKYSRLWDVTNGKGKSLHMQSSHPVRFYWSHQFRIYWHTRKERRRRKAFILSTMSRYV